MNYKIILGVAVVLAWVLASVSLVIQNDEDSGIHVGILGSADEGGIKRSVVGVDVEDVTDVAVLSSSSGAGSGGRSSGSSSGSSLSSGGSASSGSSSGGSSSGSGSSVSSGSGGSSGGGSVSSGSGGSSGGGSVSSGSGGSSGGSSSGGGSSGWGGSNTGEDSNALVDGEIKNGGVEEGGCNDGNDLCEGADINEDGDVNEDDLNILLDSLGGEVCVEAEGFCDRADLDGDGNVAANDLSRLLGWIGTESDCQENCNENGEGDYGNSDDLDVLLGWLGESECGEENNWCDGTDLDGDGNVAANDLSAFLGGEDLLSFEEEGVGDAEVDDESSEGEVDECEELSALVERLGDNECNEENNWCDGTDLDGDGNVATNDLSELLGRIEADCSE